MDTLIIGYGNTLRSDDGVGVRVAEWVAQQAWANVCALSVQQLTPELAEEIAHAKQVIFVDAIASADTNITINKLTAEPVPISIGHREDPRSILWLTKQLYGQAPPACWILIPGQNFELGEEISPIAQQGFKETLTLITTILSA